MVGRTPEAARQLASRARRRVKGAELRSPDPNLARQRHVVDAFFRAARGGDFDALVALLDPEVVLRSDFGARRQAMSKVVHGAAAVARQAMLGALPGAQLHPALVSGAAGVVITVRGRPFAVMGFTVTEGRIVEIDAIADPKRVRRIAAAVLSEEQSTRWAEGAGVLRIARLLIASAAASVLAARTLEPVEAAIGPAPNLVHRTSLAGCVVVLMRTKPQAEKQKILRSPPSLSGRRCDAGQARPISLAPCRRPNI